MIAVTGATGAVGGQVAMRLGRKGIPQRLVVRDAQRAPRLSGRAGTGAPWEIEGWVSSYAAIANGEMARVSGAVAKLTGREPQSLISFLRTHPETYQHLLRARYRQH